MVAKSANDIRAGGAFVEVWGDTDPLAKALKSAERMVADFGKKLAAVGAGITAVGAGILAPLKASLDAFGEDERAVAQLEAALKSTGHAAGLTSRELQDAAAQFQRESTFGDEKVIALQTSLLRFGDIGRDVFHEATQAAIDLAAALGTDLQSAAQQVGMALGDPVEGLTRLRRSGIIFSESQRNVIKALTETGRKADAQKIILQELNRQFGGRAAADLKTWPGIVKVLGNAFGDLQEDIGRALKPSEEFVKSLLDMIERAREWVQQNPETIVGLKNLAVALFGVGVAATSAGVAMIFFQSGYKWVVPLLAVFSGLVYAILYMVDALGLSENGMRDLAEGVRIGTLSMAGYFDIFGASFRKVWLEIQLFALKGMEWMVQYFGKTMLKMLNSAIWAAQKLGLISEEEATDLKKFLAGDESGLGSDLDKSISAKQAELDALRGPGGVMDKMVQDDIDRQDAQKNKKDESDAERLKREMEEKIEAAKGEAEKAAQDAKEQFQKDLDVSLQEAKDRINKRSEADQMQLRLQEWLKPPTMPDAQSGIIGALGGANIAERLGQIGIKTVDREQLDTLRSIDGTLGDIEKNTAGGMAASFA